MKKTLIIFSIVLLAFSFVTGCSRDDATSKASEKEPVETAAPAEKAEPAVTAAEEKAAFPREFTDRKGHTVTIEKQPERITLLHNMFLEHFYILDSDPTACALTNFVGESVPIDKMLEPYMDGPVMDIGKSTNLEAILESDPDIIATFYSMGTVDKIYDELSAIAPVILLDHTASWEDQLREVAYVVGKEAYAEELITEIHQNIRDTKAEVEKHPEVTFALLRPQGKDLVTKSEAWYYDQWGLTAPENWPAEEETISLEFLAKADPSVIAFIHNEAGVKSYLESFANNAVWNNLTAVKNGDVYIWPEPFNSFGPVATKLTAEYLRDIYEAK